MILDKVYKPFFHCEDFMNWVYKLNLTHMFLLPLEIKFKRELYLHDEGYDTDANYDSPQPFKMTTHIYVVRATAETAFQTTVYLSSTPKGRPAEPTLHWMAHRHLKFGDPPPPAVDPNNNLEEENSYSTPGWIGLVQGTYTGKDLCIHIAPRRPEGNYHSDIPTQPQEPLYDNNNNWKLWNNSLEHFLFWDRKGNFPPVGFEPDASRLLDEHPNR